MKSPISNDCGGGALPDLEIAPQLDSLEKNSFGREALSYHLEFANRVSESVRVNYSVTLSDDSGKTIQVDKAPSPITAPVGATVATPSLATPDLIDGFYHVAIVAVELGRSVQASNTADIYLEVNNGQISEVEQGEWFRRSLARTPVHLQPTQVVTSLGPRGIRGGQ